MIIKQKKNHLKIFVTFQEYGRARLTAYYLLRDMLTGANDNKDMQMPPQFTEDLLRSPKNPFYKTYIENN